MTHPNLSLPHSFQAFPPPNLQQYPTHYPDYLHTFHYLPVSLQQLQHNFKKYHLLNDQLKFLKACFKHTLPTAP
ncbi:TylF/MycF/NovP-related O-methyltransferase, partial [Bacillus thuringiensis]|uniref:TylF/MycF/NovP-related O-methyltransferase n=1 Tax=Bacillus thuringiensis TaxID=1428 RepID=UPI003C12F8CD